MTDNENIMDFEEMDNTVVMEDEEGNEVTFEFIDLIEYNGREYVVLLPLEDSAEPGEVAILEVTGGDGEMESYESIEDDDTRMAVFEIFKEKFAGDFTFVD